MVQRSLFAFIFISTLGFFCFAPLVKAFVLIPVVDSYKGRHKGIWKNKPLPRTGSHH
jgi:hypothetical protein